MSLFKVPNGYNNIGNSCYMNSVFQCFRSCHHFINRLKETNPDAGTIAYLFKSLINSSENEKVFLKQLKKKFTKHIEFQNKRSGQEDANEFLLFFLANMHKDLRKPETRKIVDNSIFYSNKDINLIMMDDKAINVNNMSSIIADYFIGIIKNTVTCMNCQFVEQQSQVFYCLSIPIVGSRNVKLRQCYNIFVSSSTTDENNKVICGDCGKNGQMMLKSTVEKWPEFLIIQLQRAIFKESVIKCSIEVECPLILDLSIPVDDKIFYELISFINYSGNARFGHYTSICKHNDQWFQFDDSKVYKYSNITKKLSNAYILFYKKIKTNIGSKNL